MTEFVSNWFLHWVVLKSNKNRLVKMTIRGITKNSINTKKWQYLKNHSLKLIQLCAGMFLVWSRFDFLNGAISNWCILTVQGGRQGPLLKLAYKHENDDISRIIGWYWSSFGPESFLYEGVFFIFFNFFFCYLAFQHGCHLSLLKIAQNMKMTISQ